MPNVRRAKRPAVASIALAAALSAGLLGCGTNPSPSPSGPVALADKPALAVDGKISDGDLAHDSRDDLYRTPFGAVPAGTKVTLRLRAAAGDLSEATVRVWDGLEELQAMIPMEVVATDPTEGEHGFDFWQATINTPGKPTVLYYRFIARDGSATRYVEDDLAADGAAVPENNDGGSGVAYAASPDMSWQVDVYEPDFTTPSWTRGAVVYQIFPDRFLNGDPTNDPSPTAKQGTTDAAVYRYGDVYGNPVLPKAWTDRPEGYCRAYQGVPCDEAPLGRDFFGGDLAGITAKLDDLADLGVTVLYLNPIFAAPSNHRYDTSSYEFVDPDLGTMDDFEKLAAEAEKRGMRLLLDGAFNHVSSDSPWFDRSRRFADLGACEAANAPTRSWFTFRPPAANEPAPCAPSTAGGGDTYYVGWFGFDTIPEVIEQPAVYDMFVGPDGIAPRWVKAGTAGWRLDVMDNLSHGFMRKIRAAVKAADPDALVLGEQWGDTSNWLLGDEADSTMNYRFRRAVIGLVNGETPDLDGAISGLTPSQFASRMEGVREDYPAPAFDALLNLVDSHDTTRILWTLTPGRDDPAVKESAAALAEGKSKLRLVAAIQLTWPGMASIYYGTEAGLTGHDDPDDRRPYPWDDRDEGLRQWYRALGRLRADHVSLREGDLRFVHVDDAAGTLGWIRRADTEAALAVFNLSGEQRTIELDVAGHLPNGARLLDSLLGLEAAVGANGRISIELPARGVAVLITAGGTDLTPPSAPAGLTGTAAAGHVSLAWTAPSGADVAGYDVLRSIVAGGGYRTVGTATDAAFTDRTARNGTRYRYVIVARDAAGNASARSTEVEALPVLTIADARLEDPAAVSQPLSAVDPGAPIKARVRVDGATASAGPTVGIRAQLGFGPAASTDPAADYRWSDMAFDSDVDGADRLTGTVQPDELGTYSVVLRVSADGGETWAYADRGGIVAGAWTPRADKAVALTAVAGADTDTPPVPKGLAVKVVTASSLTLGWDAVTVPDLFRYEVYRAAKPGGPFERVGTAIEPTFTDDTVGQGDEYVYVVVAVDTSFNRSARSPEIAAAAQAREVSVIFTVRLPASTPAGDTIFIAGDFQGWIPGGTPMTKVDATTWTISLPFTEGEPPQYKYTRGTWEEVEKDAGCAEIPNRTFDVAYGADGTQQVADTVEKWRDVDNCG
jgi:glycosidase